MERIAKITSHPEYKKKLLELQETEKDRIYCRHTFEHFLDVARLMYIQDMENGACLKKEIIYAAALLHDIGRNEQYRVGTPHDEASAELAGKILPECGFLPDEISMIRYAIFNHRMHQQIKHDTVNKNASLLASYLYQADKQSRNCFFCPAKDSCNWPDEKKNQKIYR